MAANLADAARQALEAGIDIELPDAEAFPTLIDQVKDGRVSESAIDRAVARGLRAKLLARLDTCRSLASGRSRSMPCPAREMTRPPAKEVPQATTWSGSVFCATVSGPIRGTR